MDYDGGQIVLWKGQIERMKYKLDLLECLLNPALCMISFHYMLNFLHVL